MHPGVSGPLLILALLTAGPARAQMGGHGHHAVPAEGARLTMRDLPDEHAIVLAIGPVLLPAAGEGMMQLTPAYQVRIPVDGWITGFEARILDLEGNPLPDELLHHINLVMPERRELFLPIMQRLAAAGQETGRIGVPWPLGVPVRRGEPVVVVAMVHNPTGAPVDLQVEARLTYDPPAGLDRVAVQPFFMDVQPPPDEASFDLPPGRSELSWEGRPAVDVRLLGLGGHIHRFGQELRLEEIQPDGTTKVLWRARPELEGDGDVAAVPRKTFLLRLGLPLRADRTYRLHAIYQNPTADTIAAGGMAEIAGVVVPRAEWPSADTTAARYLADYRNFTRFNPALRDRFGPVDAATDGRAGHGHH